MRTAVLLIVAMLSLAIFSCQKDEPKDPVEQNGDSTNADTNKVVQQVELKFEVLSEGWRNPWGINFLPDGRLLITERPGNLYLYDEETDEKTEVSGLPSGSFFTQGQGGLLDVVMHPDYDENGWIYFTYSKQFEGGANTAVFRSKLEGTSLVSTEEIYLAKPAMGGGIHFGSRLAFDNDGFLYVSIGERGRMAIAQDRSNPNGCVLRLNDDGSVPADNPFMGQEDVLPEIYSYGHRNPQGLRKNPVTGDIWVHEHGPKGGDEINIVGAGNNYGWPEVTFGVDYDGTVISPDTAGPGFTQPIHYWDPSIAPCGMDFLAHERYGQYENTLLVGALALRKLVLCYWSNGDVYKTEDFLRDNARFRDIKLSPDGFIYIVCEAPGQLIKLVPEPI